MSIPSAPALISQAWKTSKVNYEECLKATAPVFVIMMLSMITMAIGLPGAVLNNKAEMRDALSHAIATNDLSALFSYGLIFLLGVATEVAAIWTCIVLYRLLDKSAAGEKTTIGQVKKDAWKRFWPLLGLGIVLGVYIVLGSILFVIPGIVIALTYWASEYILIVENKSVADAMRISKERMKGKRWALLGRLVLMGILVGIPAILFTMILVGIFGVIGGTFGATGVIVGAQIGNYLALFFLLPFLVSLSVVINRALK